MMRWNSKLPCIVALSIVASLLTVAAIANDGYLSLGGDPHLMDGGTTVSMVAEDITVDSEDDLVKVDCRFEFKNNGPACSVRMGFPEYNYGSAFLTYESYVDGKQILTETVKSKQEWKGPTWHTKTVSFPANATRYVRDCYKVEPGMRVAAPRGGMKLVGYIVNTASSWNGPIKEMSIKVILRDASGTVNPIAISSLPGDKDPAEFVWTKSKPNTVLYRGPVAPKVLGSTLIFKASNIRPRRDDDVFLCYRYRDAKELEKWEDERRSHKAR